MKRHRWFEPGPTWHVLAIGIVVMAAASACRSVAEPTSVTSGIQSAASGDASVTTLPGGPDDPIQDEILSDGSVSHAEMETVLDAVVECVREEGYSAEITGFEHGERGGFSVSGGTTREETDRAADRFYACSAQFMSRVEPAYAKEYRPTELERQAREQAALSCLLDAGFDIEGVDTFGSFLAGESIEEQLRAFDLCGHELNSNG